MNMFLILLNSYVLSFRFEYDPVRQWNYMFLNRYWFILNLHLTRYSKQSIHKPSGKHSLVSLAFKEYFFLSFLFCAKGLLTPGRVSRISKKYHPGDVNCQLQK